MSARYDAARRDFLREVLPGRNWREVSALYFAEFGETLTAGQVRGMRERLGCRGRAGASRGNVPGNSAPVGTERTDDHGTWVKVYASWRDDPESEGLQEPPRNACWRLKHHVVWEQANGAPVPSDCRIVFADRDRANFDPENLVAVDKGLLACIWRNGWEYYDRETLQACVTMARIRRKKNQDKREYDLERNARR